jgi:hypothetical protein
MEIDPAPGVMVTPEPAVKDALVKVLPVKPLVKLLKKV